MTYSDQTPTDDYPPPNPPRGCGNAAKRVLGCGCGVVLLILIALAATDGILAARYGAQVQQKLQQLRAAGKPLTGPELAPSPVLDAENAAPLYLKAAEIVKPHAGQSAGPWGPNNTDVARTVGYSESDWDNPKEMAALADLLTQDREALRLMWEATNRPACVFDVNWQSAVGTLFPHLSKMRTLARFESAAAAVSAFQGRQGEALERLRMGFVASRRVGRDPTLIAALVSSAMDAIMLRSAEYVLSRGPVPEGAARRLTEELRSTDGGRAFARAMQGERVTGLESFAMTGQRSGGKAGGLAGAALAGSLAGGGGLLGWLHGSALGPVLRPFLLKDELIYLDLMDRMEQTAATPWPAADASARRLEADIRHVHPWAVLTRMILPVLLRARTKAETTTVRRELLQIALGLHVYRQKHGAYPDSLDALRSLGWPVPLDRFSGKPFIYRCQGDRFLLYSIGQDMKDDSGKPISYLYHDRQKHPSPKQGNTDVGDLVWMDWDQG
jgi:hypothetical protein